MNATTRKYLAIAARHRTRRDEHDRLMREFVIAAYPGASIRDIAKVTGLGSGTVHRIIREHADA